MSIFACPLCGRLFDRRQVRVYAAWYDSDAVRQCYQLHVCADCAPKEPLHLGHAWPESRSGEPVPLLCPVDQAPITVEGADLIFYTVYRGDEGEKLTLVLCVPCWSRALDWIMANGAVVPDRRYEPRGRGRGSPGSTRGEA